METLSVLLASYEGESAGPWCILLIYKGSVMGNYGLFFAVELNRLEKKSVDLPVIWDAMELYGVIVNRLSTDVIQTFILGMLQNYFMYLSR